MIGQKPALEGATPFLTCHADPRFSYCLYIPQYCAVTSEPSPLLVFIHGSTRPVEEYRKRLADFAEETGCVVLLPLFPCGIAGPDDTESYKFVYHKAARYDLVLLAMVEEARKYVAIAGDRFFLAGYSGGGQFAHRFLYGYPERLNAVSIGAPGNVTLPEEDKPWWVGLKGLGRILGRPIDYPALTEVPVHLFIGSQDTETDQVLSPPHSPHYMQGINDCGSTRLQRMNALVAGLRNLNIQCHYDIVPGVGHNGFALMRAPCQFFKDLQDGNLT